MSAQRDQGEAGAALGTGQPTGDIEGFNLAPEKGQEERSQQPWGRCRCGCHRSCGSSLKCRPGSKLCPRKALDDERTSGWGGKQRQAACVSQSGSEARWSVLKARPQQQIAGTGTDSWALRLSNSAGSYSEMRIGSTTGYFTAGRAAVCRMTEKSGGGSSPLVDGSTNGQEGVSRQRWALLVVSLLRRVG